jgi:hypothetical protein
VRGAARHHDEVAVLGSHPAAVPEDVPALDLVYVEDGRAHREGGAVAEPQPGADPRPELEVGVRRPKRLHLGVRQV